MIKVNSSEFNFQYGDQIHFPCRIASMMAYVKTNERVKNNFTRFSFFDYPNLTFEKPDIKTFSHLQLAFNAMEKGGNMPCILNAANEIAVAAFLQDEIGFLNMADLIADCMEKITFVPNPMLDDYVSPNTETRILANELL